VGLRFGLAQLELAAAGDHLFAVEDELLHQILQVENLGLSPHDGQEGDAEGGLHLGMLEELVQDHLGRGVALELDDHPHPFPIRLVPQVGDSLDSLVLDQFGDALQQLGLVDLIRISVRTMDSRSVRFCLSISARARIWTIPLPVR